jgi:hypothetical protein
MMDHIGPYWEEFGDVRQTSEQIDRAILDTAAHMFASHGYAGTSVQQVADAVGYSTAWTREQDLARLLGGAGGYAGLVDSMPGSEL